MEFAVAAFPSPRLLAGAPRAEENQMRRYGEDSTVLRNAKNETNCTSVDLMPLRGVRFNSYHSLFARDFRSPLSAPASCFTASVDEESERIPLNMPAIVFREREADRIGEL